MSEAAGNEITTPTDHQLNTLTDIVSVVGETRSDVKVLDHKVDALDHKVGELDHKVGELDHKVGELDHKVDRLEQKFDEFSVEQKAINAENSQRFDRMEGLLMQIADKLSL